MSDILMISAVDLLSRRDGGSDHREQLQSLHRVQGSQWDFQLQAQLHTTGQLLLHTSIITSSLLLLSLLLYLRYPAPDQMCSVVRQ